jgi:fatty acid desaturase
MSVERGEPEPESVKSVATADPAPRRQPRPVIERIGLAAVALVLAILFGGVAAASWIGGELFLAVMGAVGCLMTLWVGALTLFRG